MPAGKSNPIEQHVEKGVLAIGALVFLYCLVAYVVRSPVSVQIANRPAKPGQAYAVVRDAAEGLDRQAAQAAWPTMSQPVTTQPIAKLHLDPLPAELQQSLPAVVPPGLEFDHIADPKLAELIDQIKPKQLYDLPSVVSPTRLAVHRGRSEIKDPTPSGQQRTVSWITVAAQIDLDRQRDLLQDLPDAITDGREPRFVRVDLQRAEVNQQGELGQWVDIAPTTDVKTSILPLDQSLVRDSTEDITDIRQKINDSSLSTILNPEFPQVVTGAKWTIPTVDGEKYKPQDESAKPDRPQPPQPQHRPWQADMRPPGGGLRRPVPPSREPAGAALRDDRQPDRTSNQLSKTDTGGLKVWAFDLTAIPGKTYTYRMRVVMYNPLAGYRYYLTDADNALKVGIASPWVQPAKPVVAEKDVYVFVSSADTADAASVTIYKWHMGWLCRGTFTVRVGQEIGGTRMVKIGDERTSQETRTSVEFSTGMILLDVKPSATVQVGKPRTVDGKLVVDTDTNATILIARDRDGNLIRQDSVNVRNDEDYKLCRRIQIEQNKKLKIWRREASSAGKLR